MSEAKLLGNNLEDQAENCGVEFTEKCFTDNYLPYTPSAIDYEEDIGECEEYDEECIENYLRMMMGRGIVPQAPEAQAESSGRLSLKKSVSQGRKPSVASKSDLLTPEPPYDGLPEEMKRKNYRPDYPTELKMRLECTMKPFTKKAPGTTKTHAKAVFTPSLTKMKHTGKSYVDPALLKIMDEPSPLELNRMPPPIVSSSDELIVDWLADHNVQMMLEYFLGLCVIHRPDNPWEFISQLCEKMMEARTSIEAFDTLPRLLTPEHTEAIFRIYDRIENGFISMAQYKSAMEAMGLSTYSISPEGAENDAISKDTFVKEGTDAINQLLRSFMVFEADESMEEEAQEARKSSMGGVKKSFDAKRFSKKGDEEISPSGSYTYNSSSAEYSDEDEDEEYEIEEEGEEEDEEGEGEEEETEKEVSPLDKILFGGEEETEGETETEAYAEEEEQLQGETNLNLI